MAIDNQCSQQHPCARNPRAAALRVGGMRRSPGKYYSYDSCYPYDQHRQYYPQQQYYQYYQYYQHDQYLSLIHI